MAEMGGFKRCECSGGGADGCLGLEPGGAVEGLLEADDLVL